MGTKNEQPPAYKELLHMSALAYIFGTGLFLGISYMNTFHPGPVDDLMWAPVVCALLGTIIFILGMMEWGVYKK